MKLWSWLRNHQRLNDLEDEIHGLSEALKVALNEGERLVNRLNESTECLKDLNDELEELRAAKVVKETPITPEKSACLPSTASYVYTG